MTTHLFRPFALFLFALGAFLPLVPFSQAAGNTPEPVHLDLQEKGNRLLTDDHHGFKGNNLAELKTGKQIFAGVTFKVGEKFLSLGSKEHKELPLKIEGLKLDRTASKIHFLHGTGYGAGGFVVADDAPLGEYLVHYADDTQESVPIVYGQDVRDWWSWDKPFEVTRGKVAWTGMNQFSREEEQKIRLYLGTWVNPKPDVKILRIDYISNGKTSAVPFCIAITAEPK
jgi:hypothetical protein